MTTQHDDESEPRSAVAPKPEPKIPALFNSLGLLGITTRDKFTLTYADGTLKAQVKRSTGVVQKLQRNVKAGFREMTEFDPSKIRNKAERNKLIRQRYAKGATQQEVAEEFGISQSMVNRIVND